MVENGRNEDDNHQDTDEKPGSRSGSKEGNAVAKQSFREKVGQFVERPQIEIFIVCLVVAYSLLVFTQIIIDDEAFKQQNQIGNDFLKALTTVDVVILVFFLLEVSMKTFAFGCDYFKEWLYVFDAVIVVGSLCMACVELQAMESEDCGDDGNDKDSAACAMTRFTKLRAVMRLLRIIIMFRKVQNVQHSVRALVTSDLGFNITSPVERVLGVLNELKENRELTRALRSDVQRAVRIIASNQLYEPVLETKQGEDVNQEAQAWINNASTNKQKAPPEQKGEKEALIDKQKGGVAPMAGISRQSVMMSAGDRDQLNKHMAGAFQTMSFDICDEAKEMIQKGLEQYNFDIFHFDTITSGNSLRAISTYAIMEYDLESQVNLNRAHWENFVAKVQSCYVLPPTTKVSSAPPGPMADLPESTTTNPYHGALHAADVTQTVLWMLLSGGLNTVAHLKIHEFFAMVLAATIHDFQHPGYNNVFCTRSRHPLALRYNDKAVLEMSHVAGAYELIHSNPKYNFFSAVGTDPTYQAIREIVISTILATDMSTHFSELGQFKSRIQAGDFLKVDEESGQPKKEDKLLIMNVTLHACDISNPAKNSNLYLEWTGRVLQEFFAQGDQEKAGNLPVSMFMDRDTTNIAKCQLGFIDVLVFPLFDAVRSVMPDVDLCCQLLESNKVYWQPKVEDMEEEMKRGTQKLPPPEVNVLKKPSKENVPK
jgi:hypothetical protein